MLKPVIRHVGYRAFGHRFPGATPAPQRILFLLGVALFAAASPLGAATRYVASTGDGSGGPTWAQAHTNLQEAVNAAASGDIILVRQGTYIWNNQVLVNAKSLTISGGYLGETPEPGGYTNDPTVTVLNSSRSNRVFGILNCATALVERLTFRNGSSLAGAGILATNSTVTFRDCVIRDNVVPTSGGGGGLYMNGGNVSLLRCKLRNNNVSGTSYGGAVYQNGGRLTLDSCWVAGNVISRDGGGLYVAASAGTRLVNSLVVNNVAAQNYGGVFVYAGAVSVANCTVAGNCPNGLVRNTGTLAVSNCIVWNNGDDLYGVTELSDSCVQNPGDAGPGVIHDDPGFFNGYRLPPGSPCIDAGGATAAELGLDTAYTELATPDSLAADLGYHYPTSCAIQELYVSPSGTDDASHGAGPGAAAFRSITYALSRARDDSRLYLEAAAYGTNVETFPLIIARDNLGLVGTNAAATILNASGANQSVLRISGAVGCVLSNVTLAGGRPPASVGGAGLLAYLADVSATDCVIRDNQGVVSGNSGGGLYAVGGAVDLLRCKIRNNRVAESTSGGGICRVYGHLSLRSCVLANNRNDSGGFGSGGALYASGVGSTRLWNCLVVNNSDNSIALHNAGGSLAMANSTLADNKPHGLYTVGATTISNSILWANGTDLSGTFSLADSCVGGASAGPGVIHADPRFTAVYRLDDASPCIDAGGGTAFDLGLAGTYTQTGATDVAAVDLGYHAEAEFHYTNRYVSTLGTDDASHGGGPGAAAYRSLTYALANAPGNTRIFIEAGTYASATETFPLSVSGKDGIHLLGTNAAATVINATNTGQRVLILANALDCGASNLTVTGGSGSGAGAGLYLTMASARLSDCDIRHNRVVNGYGQNGSGVSMNGGTLDLLRCKLRNNTGTGSTQGGGLYAVTANLSVRECVVSDNILAAAGANENNGGGLAAVSMGYARLVNSLFLRNTAEAGHGIWTSGGAAVVLTNCTVADNPGHGFYSQSAGARVRNSIFWGNVLDLVGTIAADYTRFDTASGYTDLGHNTSIDPRFVDTTYFHLKSRVGGYDGGFFDGGLFLNTPDTSPLIDAGDPVSDYSREPIPSRALEMGAYGNTPVASMTPMPGFVLSIR